MLANHILDQVLVWIVVFIQLFDWQACSSIVCTKNYRVSHLNDALESANSANQAHQRIHYSDGDVHDVNPPPGPLCREVQARW